MIFFSRIIFTIATLWLSGCDSPPPKKPGEPGYQRPNFLFIISDDQSWQHTSFAGYPYVHTPNFDQIAKKGVYFENAYAAAPSCTASRSSVLTGQYPWRLGSAAVLGGEWPDNLQTYPQILKQHGYHVGYTGKGWGPGRVNNENNPPDGTAYYFEARKKYFWQRKPPHPQATSLAQFLHLKPKDQPFAFWIGIREPHRPFEKGDTQRFKKSTTREFIPDFLPDTQLVREDLAAYLEQIERFDKILGQIIDQLKDYDAMENTIIIVTSDNGMSFSRAKTQNYQYGLHIPLAIYWKGITRGTRQVSDMVGLYDIAPTLLEAAEIEIPAWMNGKSLIGILYSNQSGQIESQRTSVFTLTERHSIDARPGQLGYPTRAIYTRTHALIKNYFPDRWPTGDNHAEAEPHLLFDQTARKPLEPYFSLATAKRPSLELYALGEDPYQLTNLADSQMHEPVLSGLKTNLENVLKDTGDPLELTGKDHFSVYPWAMR